MEIFLIAAVDKNLAIGKNGRIPWHIKEDLQYFQKNTLNTAMIMGRSTFDSIGKALPNRPVSYTHLTLPTILLV